jgi:hypothetical protein
MCRCGMDFEEIDKHCDRKDAIGRGNSKIASAWRYFLICLFLGISLEAQMYCYDQSYLAFHRPCYCRKDQSKHANAHGCDKSANPQGVGIYIERERCHERCILRAIQM